MQTPTVRTPTVQTPTVRNRRRPAPRAVPTDRRRRPRWWWPAAGLALTLLLLSVATLAAVVGQSGTGGYLTTPPTRIATPTAAVSTDEIQVGDRTAYATDPEPDLGEAARVRVRVTPEPGSAPLFVGIGPKAEVDAYLSQVAHERFVRADLEPFRPVFAQSSGHAEATPPAGQDFWVASATGSGPLTLDWDKTHGAWTLVLLRADGSPGVAASVDIGLRFGQLLPIGLLSGLGGLVLVAVLVRTRNARK